MEGFHMEAKGVAALAISIVLALVWLFISSPMAPGDVLICKILTFISKILCALGAAWLSCVVTIFTHKRYIMILGAVFSAAIILALLFGKDIYNLLANR